MRTTLDLPKDLLDRTVALSGAKTKREAVRRALVDYTRRKAIDDIRALRGKIEFSVTAEELEAREIRGQRKRRKSLGSNR